MLGRIAADVMAEPNAVHVLPGSNHQGARSLYVENVVGRGMQPGILWIVEPMTLAT